MSPRKLFEQELEELRQDVLQMAEWVQDGYDCLFAALETGPLKICRGTSSPSA